MNSLRSTAPSTKKLLSLIMLIVATAILSTCLANPAKAQAATKAPATPIAKVSVSSDTAIKVKWKAVSGSKGYQVRYSTNKDMSHAKRATLTGKNTTSCKISGLKSKTTYYVQVRSYSLTSSKAKKVSKYTQAVKVKTNYSIIYSLGGGTQAAGQKTNYNKTTGTIYLQDPTKVGYLFLGWYDNSKLTGKRVTKIPAGSTGTKHFYAKWQPRTSPNAQIIFNYCVAQGMTSQCAAAIVGNAMQESGCNPEAVGYKSYGIFQWSGSRYTRLKAIAKERGTTWKDIECQLLLLTEELPPNFEAYTGWTGTYNFGEKATYGWKDDVTFAQWCKWKDIEAATRCFEQVYERAGTPMMDNRISYAKAAYEAYA